jgi:hypothetical protein
MANKPALKTDAKSPRMDFTLSISNEQLINILQDAGIGYWGTFFSHKAIEEMVNSNKSLVITDTEEGVKHIITQVDLKIAVRIIAVNYPHLIAGLFGDYDATTGDVLVQCACFGDIIYG